MHNDELALFCSLANKWFLKLWHPSSNKLIRTTHLCCCYCHCCCSWETMRWDSAPSVRDFRGDTFYPHITVTMNPFPGSLILNKIHRGDLKASHRNKYSAQLTPHEPFTRSGGESCIFYSNLFLIRPLPSPPPKKMALRLVTCLPQLSFQWG